jgi:GT2 family glycosyltransferase
MINCKSITKRIVVTVTYGNRWPLLRQALISAQREGFDQIVVVNNGSSVDISQLASNEFPGFVDVVFIGRNSGSAGGFKAGMQRALDLGADYVMLLDDDNEMQPGCLAALEATYNLSVTAVSANNLSVLAYRSDRQADVATSIPASGMAVNRAAFFGFHLLDVPFKIFRRTPVGRRWIASRPMLSQVVVGIAPYSGMYFHRSVLETHGLPDERYFLYADDTDFSYRLTHAGGKIVLATQAELVDLELSWNVKARFSNTFDALLLGDGDFRAFYSTRNNAYFERSTAGPYWLIRSVNRAIYLAALRIRASSVGRVARFDLLMRAIRDGEAGRLGENPDFPLQQSASSLPII